MVDDQYAGVADAWCDSSEPRTTPPLATTVMNRLASSSLAIPNAEGNVPARLLAAA